MPKYSRTTYATPVHMKEKSTDLMKLSMSDAWMLYRLAYFPNVPYARKVQAMSGEGITEFGRRVAMVILGNDVSETDNTVKAVAIRYLGCAKSDRLSL